MSEKDHQRCLEALKKSQEAEHDLREHAREAQEFVTSRTGQWEQHWWDQNTDKPRYTFDLTDPLVDQIAGDIEQHDFAIQARPMGGGADKQTAETFEGLIRTIERKGGAKRTYNRKARECVITGLSGWRVSTQYCDGDSFDQDLVIKPIHGYLDRVWHGFHEEPDGSDAPCCWVLSGMTEEDFKERFPSARHAGGVETDRSVNTFYHRRDLIMVGEYLYFKEVDREIALMTDGRVVALQEVAPVLDELAAAGITIVSTRTRKVKHVYSRKFSQNEWLTEPEETVFRHWIPVIPLYGNFAVVDDKVTYRGAVEKLMDPQRVFNYALSREVEEGALAPRAKYWMTENQAEGHEDQLSTMNTNADPVQFYNPDPLAPGAPQQSGGGQVNPGLRNISEAMRQLMGMTAGMFAANMGDNPGLQSGVAIEALQDRGDVGNNKYVLSLEDALAHTGRILVDAIPRVYGPQRQVQILGEDGAQQEVMLAQLVMDEQTGQPVTINDLNQGQYDVECSSGPSLKSRQSETVNTLVELGKVDPEVIQLGGDILAKNVNAPGMDDISERKRQILFRQGLIPPEQLTDEEKQQLQAMANQPPAEDPNMVLARAEEQKAIADQQSVQQKAVEAERQHQIKLQELAIKQAELQLEGEKLRIEAAKAGVDIKLKGAQAAKTLAEAEAQDVETEAFVTGVAQLAEVVSVSQQEREQEASSGSA